jgi:hypothetical protein
MAGKDKGGREAKKPKQAPKAKVEESSIAKSIKARKPRTG